MTVEYYVAPVQSNIPIRGGTATVTASRVLLYLNPGVTSTSSLIPREGSFGWTVTVVDADAATHTAIQADNQIIWLSITDRAATWGSLTGGQRNKILNGLAGLGIDSGFITDATTLQQIIDRLFSELAGTFA